MLACTYIELDVYNAIHQYLKLLSIKHQMSLHVSEELNTIILFYGFSGPLRGERWTVICLICLPFKAKLSTV